MRKFSVPLLVLSALLAAAPAPAADVFRCPVASLRPTQLSVGMREVADKENRFSQMSAKKLDKYLQENPEPVVAGPGGLYMVDHHHLARALADIGVGGTYCTQLADYSKLSADDFWGRMEAQHWVYPYDENGRGPVPYSQIPSGVDGLRDDPYRSLAAAVRDDGGYRKTDEPFAEFKWADFFRSRVDRAELDSDFGGAEKKALPLASSHEAASLPGYIGNN